MQIQASGTETKQLIATAQDLARRVFGFHGLRLDQVDVLKEVLAGRDTLAVLPTGSGKSLTFAIPALMGPGIVVVISPLVALIRDQVIKFRKIGIAAAAFDSQQTPEQKKQVVDALRAGRVKLLFISPERFSYPRFRDFLQSLNIVLFAIDEAHCISQWGFNFRPEYRKLGDYLDAIPLRIPRLALTATATKKVRGDILETLRLKNPAVILKNPVRSNLEIGVFRTPKVELALELLVAKIWECTGQGIVYAGTRQKVEDLTKRLSEEGMKAKAYHAGLSSDQRALAQREFLSGEARVIVATNAFGLGVDKADIRFVHHMGLTQSLEQYLQEIGRAGRDGGFAHCSLVYTTRDYHIQKFIIEKSHPLPAVLKKSFEIARDYGMEEYSSFDFFKRLMSMSHFSKEEAETSIELLIKEGYLSRVPTAHGDWRIQATNRDGLEDFFSGYGERRTSALHRLDTMFHFVASGSQRAKFVETYFND